MTAELTDLISQFRLTAGQQTRAGAASVTA